MGDKKPKPMKVTKAWALVRDEEVQKEHGTPAPLLILQTRSDARVWHNTDSGERIVRVEIREVEK